MSSFVSVQLDALTDLLGELRALGAELTEEGQLTAATGHSLPAALPGPVGEEAGLAGAGWAEGVTALAARTLAVAATLDAALAGYRATEEALAGQLAADLPGRAGGRAVPR